LVGGFTSSNINLNNIGSVGYDYDSTFRNKEYNSNNNNQYSSISNNYSNNNNNNSTNVYDQGRTTLSGYVIPKIKYRHIEDQKNKINNNIANNNNLNANTNNNLNINRQ
jgi:hypothetical protein